MEGTNDLGLPNDKQFRSKDLTHYDFHHNLQYYHITNDHKLHLEQETKDHNTATTTLTDTGEFTSLDDRTERQYREDTDDKLEDDESPQRKCENLTTIKEACEEEEGEEQNETDAKKKEDEEGTYEELICLVRQFYVEKPINPAALAHQNIETC